MRACLQGRGLEGGTPEEVEDEEEETPDVPDADTGGEDKDAEGAN